MKKNKLCAILSLDENGNELKPLTDERPIANLPFDCRYRLIDFPLSSISNANIDTVAIFLAESGRSVYDHLRNGQVWDLNSFHGGIFTFSQLDYKGRFPHKHTKKYGRYNDYVDFLKKSKAEFTVIMGSRMLCSVDINAVLQDHLSHRGEITVVYKNVSSEMIRPEDHLLTIAENNEVNHIWLAWDKQILKMQEALNMEIYLMRTATLIEILQDAAEKEHMEQLSVILRRSTSWYSTYAYEYFGYLSNIVTIKDYYNANMDMLNKENYHALFYGNQKIYTKVKNEGPSFYTKHADVKDSQVGTGCRIEGRIKHSLLFRNVVIEQDASIKDSIIMQGSHIGFGANLAYTILDKGVVIGPNVQLSGTPDNPLVITKNQKIFTREDVYTQ